MLAAEVGERAPTFTLPNTENQPVNLQDTIGKKNIVLAFFPLAFTPVCTTEMCTFRDDLKKLESLDAQIYAISVDSPFTQKVFAEKNNLNFPLLSDFNKEVVRLYGCMHEELRGFKGVAKRSVFLIDKKGIVRYRWVSENPANEPNYQELGDTLKKLSG